MSKTVEDILKIFPEQDALFEPFQISNINQLNNSSSLK